MEDVFFADLGLVFSEDVYVREESLEALTNNLKHRPQSNRPPIPEFSQTADSLQKRVIETPSNTIRLVAPAGSGKTQTMINRVLRTIQSGADANRVLLLTFDNAAAVALKTRLEESIQSSSESRSIRSYFERLPINTLNAFSNRLLGEYARGHQRPVAEDGQRYRAFRHVRQQLKDKSPQLDAMLPTHLLPQYFLDLFSFLKNEIQDPRNLKPQEFLDLVLESKLAASVFESRKGEALDAARTLEIAKVVAALYVMYDRELSSKQLMDYDDQKLRLYSFLQSNQHALDAIQNRFDEIIVDEFQDINRLDFELIKLISVNATLLVTGDDDQAIYGFRGCSPDYIIDLEKHLGREVESFELQVNYRSPANIVRHADQLIRQNTRRIVKSPIPHHQHDATITLLPTLSTAIEAGVVRELVQTAVGPDTKVNYKDIAILYRTNAQSLPLQIEFLLNEIPYYVRPADNILQSESLAKLVSLLRAKVATRAGEKLSSEDQLNVLCAYFGNLTPEQERLVRQTVGKGIDLLNEENSFVLTRLIPRSSRRTFYSDFHNLLLAGSLSEELDIISKEFGSGLKGMIGSLEEAVAREVPLAEVFDMARDYEGSTHEFLKMISQALERGKKLNAGNDSNGVSLLTYFRSKGRQWHTVILLSCNEGFIPHNLAPVEEERRLFYVAITRASSDLVLSYVDNAVHRRLKPSRFLYEAGLHPESTERLTI